jgi:hypothetical protein
MNGYLAADLLRVWERGAGQHAIDRAITMLAEAEPGADRAALFDLPIGELDDRLLLVRELTFGRRMEAVTSCPQCAERVELPLSTTGLGRHPSRPATPSLQEGAELRVRPLTSRDLAIAARCASAQEAGRVLAARCLATGDDQPLVPAPIPDDRLDEIERLLEQVDPMAARVLEVTCPNCQARWECDLDVADFLWTEIEAAALRLLRDVHTLASAYGWHERDILAMTPFRRRAYLELAQ